jgi:mono/diheme cytochrome c family protein
MVVALASLALGAGAAQAADADDASLVPQGEYLARAGDCMPCHTGDGSKPYAGGLAFPTPFGTMYSVNITSDPKFGIGKWTYDQFKAALHDGIRADGAYLYPAMPFDAYTKIEEGDLKALWAYIRRLPPQPVENTANDLAFPFNVRMGMLAWRELFFAPAYFTEVAGKSPDWNRGAYLVEALGHCSDCHSPRNVMGAIKGKEQFTGSELDGFYAPDIASAALAKTWDKANLVQFLKTGSAPNRSAVFGPMAEVVHDSLAYLADADLNAMATYLLDSPPPPKMPAPQRLSPLPADVYKRASQLYVDNCAACHQPLGVGVPGSIPPLADNPAVTASEPYNVLMAVLGGLPGGGSYGAMPSFAGRLSDQQVADLANYVRSSWGNKGATNATAAMAAAWRSAAAVPYYGTQSAEAFDCPKVGGGPDATGPDPDAVAQLATVAAGGAKAIGEMIDIYNNADPGSSPDTIVDALVAAYCPFVAKGNLPDYQRYAALKQFTLQAAAAVSPQTTAEPSQQTDIIWAIQAGSTIVYREPQAATGAVTCPGDSFVPGSLVEEAVKIIGAPTLPATGADTASFPAALMKAEPKAHAADIANAVNTAYCRLVIADKAADIGQQRGWIQEFGEQVIQSLQASLTVAAPTAAKAK